MKDKLDRFEETPKKKPLDRKIIATHLRKRAILDAIIAMIMVPLSAGMGTLMLLFADDVFLIAFSVLFLAMAAIWLWYVILPFILLPFGKFTVCLDCMCRKEIVRRSSGKYTRWDPVFFFSHHGSYTVYDSLYNYSEPGQLFYVVSYYGHKRSPALIFHTHQYEWVGAPEEIIGLISTESTPSDRMSNETILTRRPLTKGRKTKLTGEEIARDMVEDVRVSNGQLGLAAFGVVVLGCLLFTIEATVATIFLAVALPLCAAIGLQRAIWCAKVRSHRFNIEKDTLMDKDPLNRGIGRWKKMRFVLTFRNSGEYMLPLRDSSVYYDAELGDTFYIVRFAGKNFEGKKKTVRAVYNALDVEVENDDQ